MGAYPLHDGPHPPPSHQVPLPSSSARLLRAPPIGRAQGCAKHAPSMRQRQRTNTAIPPPPHPLRQVLLLQGGGQPEVFLLPTKEDASLIGTALQSVQAARRLS